MLSEQDLPVEICDGQYLLTHLIDEGPDGVLYFAEVDLARFDFDELISFHARRGHGTKRRRKPRSGAGEPDDSPGICRRLGLPYPRDLRAAVRCIPSSVAAKKRSLFEAEWQELISTYHPNLVRVYGGGETDGMLWYSTEVLPERRSLGKLSQLTEQELLELTSQAAEALEFLHHRHLVHGDVRPSKLAVFGRPGKLLVRVIEPVGNKLTGKGSPYYLSPAQVWGDKPDRRGDVYSLGASLYRMLTGTPPYEGHEVDEIGQMIGDGEGPVPVGELRPDLGQQTQQLLKRMMAIDANRRLQSMKEVRGVIKGILSEDRFAVSRFLDPKKKKIPRDRISPGPRKASMPLSHVMAISFAVIVCVLMLGFLVSTMGGGGASSSVDDEDPETRKQPMVDTQPGGAAKPTGDDALIGRLEALGGQAQRLAAAGKLGACQELLDQLAEVAMSAEESTRVVEAYERWQQKIGQARKGYLVSLADRAARAIGDGKKNEAQRLIDQLKQLAPEHPRLMDLEDALEK